MASAAGHLQVPEEASVAACPASLCKRDCSLPRSPFASLKSGFEVPAALRRGTTAQGNQATLRNPVGICPHNSRPRTRLTNHVDARWGLDCTAGPHGCRVLRGWERNRKLWMPDWRERQLTLRGKVGDVRGWPPLI